MKTQHTPENRCSHGNLADMPKDANGREYPKCQWCEQDKKPGLLRQEYYESPTKGPWKSSGIWVQTALGTDIASTYTWNFSDKTNEANARLIACAPEMLACLKSAYDRIDGEGYGDSVMRRMIEKLIARAEGRI